MTINETLGPILQFAHGRTIGNEPAFTFPDVLSALFACTANEIAVLGVESFTAHSEGYRTEGISTYEVQLVRQRWHDFVVQNNDLATQFVRENYGGDDHFYLLTASCEREFAGLTRRGGRRNPC